MSAFTRRAPHVGVALGLLCCLLMASGTVSAQAWYESKGNGSSAGAGSSAATGDGTSTTVTADPSPNTPPDSDQPPTWRSRLLLDVKDYYTAPLHWDLKDWAYFGGAVAAVAAAHHYDTQVRTHFIKQGAQPIGGKTKDLQDALPGAAAFAATWLYAGIVNSPDGHREAWSMLEAGGLSTVTTYAIKFAAGRERPDQTDDPNKWRHSGSSFPSLHAAAAFAVGTVLAESGNDDYRWVRRFLGYGVVGGFTAFERLKHNAHWLSDDVAGAALGGATAHYVMQRNNPHRDELTGSSFSVVPIQGGAMLTYNLQLE